MRWIIKKCKQQISAKQLKKLLNIWPPLYFTGIKVENIGHDFRQATVSMRLKFYNTNFVGTQFGGNLYAMTDPFYMLMLLQILGKDYYVWDQAAKITFIAPAREKVQAIFTITDEDIDMILQDTQSGEKYIKTFNTDIVTSSGNIIANVQKDIYIRQKQH